MIKYYKSLSWRLGTQLKTREPDSLSRSCGKNVGLSYRWALSLWMIFIMLFSYDVSAQFNYLQNFTSNNGSFTGNFTQFTGTTSCGGAGGAMRRNLYSGAATGELISPLIGTSNGNQVAFSFDYKVANWSANTTGTTGNWGSFDVQYGESAAGPWTTIATVNQSNHTVSGSCANKSYTFTPANGTAVYVRFSATWATGDYYLNFDNVSLFQESNDPPPCSTGLFPADLATDVARNAQLSWGVSAGAVSYDVFLGTSSPASFLANVAGTSYILPSAMLANTTYYYKVVPKNAIGDAVGCVEQSFTTGADLIYCDPVYTYGKTDGDLISNIEILGTTLANNTGTDEVNPAYTFFNTLPNHTAVLQAGTSYTVSVTVGSFGSQNVAAWIDYNDNGVFETSERIGFTTSSIGSNGTATFPIVLTCDPPLGIHRLRVRDVYSTAGNIIDPCATYGFGETEDYLVEISAADPCPAPTNLGVANITQTTADLSWTLGCAETAWEVAIQTPGSGEPVGAGEASASSTFLADELTLSTDYEFYVRAVCEAGVLFSDWSGPFAFSTVDNPPACTTLISPADGATGVAIVAGAAQLTWNAPATSGTEGAATFYNVYFGTTSGSLTLIGNLPAPESGDPTVGITGLLYNQTNYWRIVPVNSGGEAVGPCAEWSFTTEDVPANDLCSGAFDLGALVSPITSSTVGFSNSVVASCGSTFTTTAPESFYSIEVPNGYTLTIGLTASSYDSAHTLAYGTCGTLTEVICRDTEIINEVWTNTTGSTQTAYWIQDGWSSGSGTFTLAWSLTPPPVVVASFDPTFICGQDGGDSVVITGSNFTGASSVQFNGIEATSFVIDSDTQITAVVPAGDTAGVITVTAEPSSNGSASSVDALIVNAFPVVEPITGADTALCMPNTLVLSSLSPGGTWSSSNEAVATVVGGTVTGVSEGSVTISYTVTDNGCTTVVTYDVDVNEPVVISSFTPSQTVVTGNDATFTVAATGTGLTYQWYAFDGIDTYTLDDLSSIFGETYSGSTSSTLVVGAVPSDLNGFEFYCEVTGVSPCSPETTTPNSIMNVGDTGIASDPVSVTLCDGGSTSFTVVRSGDDLEEDITYSWEYDADGLDLWAPVFDGNLDGMTISGSDTNVLSVSSITLIHSGYRFRATVSGPANFAISNPATLTVNEGVSIATQPSSALVCRIDTSANFSITAAGDVTGIQWQSSPNGVDSWTNVGTGASLTVAVSASSPVGVTYYRAVVSGNTPCLPLNSDVVTLTVQQPTIEVTPSSATYCLPGDAVSLTASGAVSYTWAPATGLSATTGATVSASPTVTTTYTVTGTDANGCVNTTNVTVSVSSQISGDATTDLTEVCANDPVQLGITPVQVSPSYPINSASYRFEATSGTFTPLVGGTATSLPVGADDTLSTSTPIGFTFNYGGTNYSNFRVNSNGLFTFNTTGNSTAGNNLASTTTTVRPGLAPLWDDLQCTAGVTYQVSGSAPNRVLTVEWLNMEWHWNSTVGISFQVKLYEGTNIIEYVYRPEAGGNPTGSSGASIGLMGTAAANYISLSDSSAAPSISTTTSTNSIGVKPAAGQIYRFIPSAPVTYTYAWSSTPSGFASTDQNPVANPSETTTYSVVVTSSAGCTHTSEVTVNVVSGAVIETQPVALSQCEGTDASFSVVATGPSLTYQWRKDGIDIVGATSATLDLTAISATDDASYDVVVTPLCGAAVTSDAVTLTVNLLPTVDASNSGIVCEGENITLTATSDIPGSTFAWTGPNGFSSTEQNPVLSNVTMANVGEYTVTVTSPQTCESTASTSVSVNPNAPLEITVSGSATTACVGELKALTASANSVGSVEVSFGTNLESTGVTGGVTFPATISGIPAGAVVTSAELQFTNVNSINGSWRSEIRVALTGAHVLGATQISTLGSGGLISPDPTVNVPGFTATSGAINLVLTESFNDGGATVDATFGTAVLVINYALPAPDVTWSPSTDLYTDEGGTVPYTGGFATTVYAKVSATSPTSYTASSVNVLGCESAASYSYTLTTTGCPSTTVVQPSQCGQTLATIDSYVYANLVAGAQGYRFRVTDMTTNEVQTIDRALRVFRLTQLTNYAFDRTYMVEVAVRRNNVWESFYGTGCTVSTPDTTTQIQASQCNTVISNVNNAIFADIVPFATGYRFRVTNTLNPIDVQTIDRPIRDFRMNLLSNIQYNTTYNVEVAVRNTDGTYLSYGPVCNITTPLFPTVGLEDAQCDEYMVSSNTEVLYAESYPGVEQYRFLLENISQPYSQTVDRATRTVSLSNFTGLLPGEMYTVRVAIRLNGVWGPYGKSCSIITPGAGRPDEVTRVDQTAVNEFKAIAYPNPFATSFTIDVKTSNTEAVSLTVYDMAGRLLEVKEVKAQDVTNYQFGDRYPSGVYNVIVTQGNETRTVRVVKQ
ncbi:GEVED domain-containing protein [Flavobacterium sp.]|uniref:GEVED domain-containing protein n=1 Tax=Flavobacterium sp. TaxID=239 RepID=UPI0035273EF4